MENWIYEIAMAARMSFDDFKKLKKGMVLPKDSDETHQDTLKERRVIK